jgi:hypothetical protein
MTTPCVNTTYTTKASGHGMATMPGPVAGRKVAHHRLVYCTHHGISLSSIAGKVVRHTCDNPACVNPEHLVLGTQLDNIADRQSRGRQARGTTHASNKLKEEDVLAIRAAKDDIKALAVRYNVTPQTIGAIINRVTWKHI